MLGGAVHVPLASAAPQRAVRGYAQNCPVGQAAPRNPPQLVVQASVVHATLPEAVQLQVLQPSFDMNVAPLA